jgi:TonB family protein
MKKRVTVLPAALFVCLLAAPSSAQTSASEAGSEKARNLNAQAVALHNQGKYEEAVKLQKQALVVWEKEFGKEHKLIATGSTNLGEMYQALKRYDEAANAYRRALKVKEKLLGPEHPDLVVLVIKLGWMHHGIAQAAEAEALFKRAIAIREKQGADSPDLAEPLLNLAALYRKLGRPAAALPIYQRVIALQEKHFGPEGQPLVSTLEQCACALRLDRKPLDASKMEQRAALIERKARSDLTPVEGAVLQGYAIHKEQPAYPQAAKAQRISGPVLIKVVIDETGKVIDARILCGADLLAVAAREAALKWRFNPTSIIGQPVKVQGVLTFNFTLQ